MGFLQLYAYSLLIGCPLVGYVIATRWMVPRRRHVVAFCAAGGAASGSIVIATLLLTELSSFRTLGPAALPFIGRHALVGLGIGLASVVIPKSVRYRLADYFETLPRELWLQRREVVLATLGALLIQAGGAWVDARLNAAPSPYVHVDAPAHATRAVRLPDESVVTLKPGSHLSYTSWFTPHDEHELTLDGEGTFLVARGSETALTLAAHGVEISASQARFTVRASDADSVAYIIVHEGLVKVRAAVVDEYGKSFTFSGGESARVGPNLQIVRGDLSIAPHR